MPDREPEKLTDVVLVLKGIPTRDKPDRLRFLTDATMNRDRLTKSIKQKSP